jgi:hypothetical protein
MDGDKQPIFLVSVIAGLVEGFLAFLIGQPPMSLRIDSVERLLFLVLCIITGLFSGVCFGILAESNPKLLRTGVLVQIVFALIVVQILILYFGTYLIGATWLT